MIQVAFLTMASTKAFHKDDHLALAPLRELGIDVVMVDWRDPLKDWSHIDLAVIRSTYDYIHYPKAFCAFLLDLTHQGVPLANPASVVAWNYHKSYLLDMAHKGLPVIPSCQASSVNMHHFHSLAQAWGTDRLVVKPFVGATSHGIVKIALTDDEQDLREKLSHFPADGMLVQPFLPQVEQEGEFSLFYFGGEFSHAVVKKPKPGDFRVQEEFGGFSCTMEPPELAVHTAAQILAAIDQPLLYARIDLIQTQNQFLLMECELIEPQLFLSAHPPAAKHFARAIAAAITLKTFQ